MFLGLLTLGSLTPLSTKAMVAEEEQGAGNTPSTTLRDPIYSYRTGFCSTDGTGDLVHGERVLRLLEAMPGSKKRFSRVSYSQDANPDREYETSLSLAPDTTPDLAIIVSYFSGKLNAGDLFLQEYGGSGNLPMRNSRTLPLGLTFNLGYIKPAYPILLEQSKEDLFEQLNPQWKQSIFSNTYSPEDRFVFGYYSPSTASGVMSASKPIPASVLKSFCESPFAAGRKVTVFVKCSPSQGEVLQEELQGTNAVIAFAQQHVPDQDWHILSQLADVSLATGDSSCSDPFFFRSLSLWNSHKDMEREMWLLTAKAWNAPEEISKERIEEYIEALNPHSGVLEHFMGTIDQKFIDDWKVFCAHIEEKYTLTPQKLACVLDIATQLTFLENLDKNSSEFSNSLSYLHHSIEYAREFLDPVTIGRLLNSYPSGTNIDKPAEHSQRMRDLLNIMQR